MSKNKKSKVKHVTYNQKIFLSPSSINSMSAVHCKIKDDGEAILRISDCNQSIRIWNDLNDNDGADEMVQKLTNLIDTIKDFRKELIGRYPLTEHYLY